MPPNSLDVILELGNVFYIYLHQYTLLRKLLAEPETNGIICYGPQQSGRSPKVVALFSATNFSSYIIELLQLHDTIQIKWKYAQIHYIIAIQSHLMIKKIAAEFCSIFLLHGKHSFGKVTNKVW